MLNVRPSFSSVLNSRILSTPYDLNVLSSTLLPVAIEISKLVNTWHKLRLTSYATLNNSNNKNKRVCVCVCGQRSRYQAVKSRQVTGKLNMPGSNYG